jgi:hypothetical protein
MYTYEQNLTILESIEMRLEVIPSDGFQNLAQEAHGEFLAELNTLYDFEENGASIPNSDVEVMQGCIMDFIVSGCQTWYDFSNYLIELKIKVCLEILKNKGKDEFER